MVVEIQPEKSSREVSPELRTLDSKSHGPYAHMLMCTLTRSQTLSPGKRRVHASERHHIESFSERRECGSINTHTTPLVLS